MPTTQKYPALIVSVKDGIGTIKFNRPESLNSFGGTMVEDIVGALRELDDHPDTTFTVITGEGRFFSSGADVTDVKGPTQEFNNDGARKMFWAQRFAIGMELVRSLIDHKKVLVLAMNGPAIGAGASWFQGPSDLFYAAEGAWLQVTFSELGLLPEMGSAPLWAHHMGAHRANHWLMFGDRASPQELKEAGIVNKIFPKDGFHDSVHNYLVEMLKGRDSNSLLEAKRLQNRNSRDARILALFEAWNAQGEKFMAGEPQKRMKAKMEELAAKRKDRKSKI